MDLQILLGHSWQLMEQNLSGFGGFYPFFLGFFLISSPLY